jgi:hypothetical protein
MERNDMKKMVLQKNHAPANRIDSMFLSETCFGTEFREFASFLVHGTEFRVGFSSAEWFGTEFREIASIFVPRYKFTSFFLLCRMILNGVFCSAEQPEFRRNKPFVSSILSSADNSEIANPRLSYKVFLFCYIFDENLPHFRISVKSYKEDYHTRTIFKLIMIRYCT